jgi:hypothetical protein
MHVDLLRIPTPMDDGTEMSDVCRMSQAGQLSVTSIDTLSAVTPDLVDGG